MQQLVRLPGSPDPAAARKGLVFLVVGLVLVLLGQLVEWYQERDVVTGAHGALPTAFGTAAPSAPSHVTRHSTGAEALVHGLSIESTNSGVRVLNLRTENEYWRYERRDDGADMPVVAVSAGTVVAWFGDGRLVGIDLRSGKVRWRTDFSRDGFQSVHLGDGQVVAQSPGGVAAFSERDGKQLWTLKVPRSCAHPLPWAVHDLPEHLTAVELGCRSSDGEDVVIGVDNRTGRVLWKRAVQQELFKADDDTLVAVAPGARTGRGRPATVQVLDVGRKGARLRAEFSSDSWAPDDAGDGVIVSSTDPEDPLNGDPTVLTAYDTQSGKRAWEHPAASGHVFGFSEIADGRVYVVQFPAVSEGDRGRVLHPELLVLDARSGDLLHTLRLPKMTVPLNTDLATFVVNAAADGVISVSWLEERHGVLLVT
ncbi:PQQ-binding-like beta-propeller repeat protein [Streptomyces sp. NPDC002896]|uniref:outer membrane protein assembly factor BamB family protein n=1 Tax=Streptomyces sp. NPDC002896 TaxID=3154438 RepID=UPI0033221B3F